MHVYNSVYTLVLFMLFMDNKIFPDECYPYAHDYLPVYTEMISFDGFEKSLCA